MCYNVLLQTVYYTLCMLSCAEEDDANKSVKSNWGNLIVTVAFLPAGKLSIRSVTAVTVVGEVVTCNCSAVLVVH
jgi:choline-glycine betaine transporter